MDWPRPPRDDSGQIRPPARPLLPMARPRKYRAPGSFGTHVATGPFTTKSNKSNEWGGTEAPKALPEHKATKRHAPSVAKSGGPRDPCSCCSRCLPSELVVRAVCRDCRPHLKCRVCTTEFEPGPGTHGVLCVQCHERARNGTLEEPAPERRKRGRGKVVARPRCPYAQR